MRNPGVSKPSEAAPATDPPGDIRSYAALDLVSQPLWVFDIDRKRIHWANRAALKIWDAATLEQLQARDMGVDMSESVAQRLSQYQSDFRSHDAVFNEQWTLYPEGQPVSLNISFRGHRIDGGRMAMLCEGQRANTDTPDSLRSVEALLHTAVMITLYDNRGRPLYRNPAARDAVRDVAETLPQRVGDASVFDQLISELDRCGQATLNLPVHTSRGERWHELSARSCRDAVTGDAAWLVSEADVTQLKHSEAQASFLALHDPLTGLPNRSCLRQHFARVVQSQHGLQRSTALLLIDLDDFKIINDTLGHAAGDELLVEVSQRLRAAVRSDDLVAHLGGDEFLILLSATDIDSAVRHLRARICHGLSAPPILVRDSSFRVAASLGAAVYPRDGEDFESLLRSADLALHAAKEAGRNALVFYRATMSAALHARTELENDLREAVATRAFEVFFQPLVRASDQRIVGAEALVRWRHPQRGMVLPAEFIPVCERLGLIRELGRLVFRAAARQRAEWSAAGFDLLVAVNMSPREFSEPGVVEDLAASLADSGCDPAGLQIEITESMLLGSDERPLATLRAIAALGLSIALDDFGTGYSNLAYLRRYPIHALKIDRSFIQGLADNGALTELIVQLCRLMHLKAVAEGVETPEQLAWIVGQGIEHYQGFLFAPPLSVAEFSARLLKQAEPPTA